MGPGKKTGENRRKQRRFPYFLSKIQPAIPAAIEISVQ
jgi:hypothetical protein